MTHQVQSSNTNKQALRKLPAWAVLGAALIGCSGSMSNSETPANGMLSESTDAGGVCTDTIEMRLFAGGCLSPLSKIEGVCLAGPVTKGLIPICAFSADGSVFVGSIGTEMNPSKEDWRFKQANVEGFRAFNGATITANEDAACQAAVSAVNQCKSCSSPGSRC